MPGNPGERVSQSPMIEFKGGSITLPILRLLGNNLHAITDQLAQKVKQAPEFFHNAPIIIDLQELSTQESLDFTSLIRELRKVGLTPIGVRGGDEVQHSLAEALGLAVLAHGKAEISFSQAEKHEAQAATANATKLIEQPIRSGQRIYAPGGDLIVLAQVSNGAEIMADGNIHIYGTLRGRALAGVKGNLNSRIFCQDLQAELISIAGHYRISEDLDESVRGKSVQIYLQGTSLIINEL